jgi:hypothetical protein
MENCKQNLRNAGAIFAPDIPVLKDWVLRRMDKPLMQSMSIGKGDLVKKNGSPFGPLFTNISC